MALWGRINYIDIMKISVRSVCNSIYGRKDNFGINRQNCGESSRTGGNNLFENNKDIVSFKSIKQLKKYDEELICFCCNKKMIPSRIYSEIQKISDKFESYSFDSDFMIQKMSQDDYTRKIVSILSEWKSRMRPVEKTVFSRIEKLNKRYPEKSLSELMRILRPKHLSKLETVQGKVLDNIDSLSYSLSVTARQKLQQFIKETRQIIADENDSDPFKRGMFIYKLHREIDNFGEKDKIKASKIIKIAKTIPNSSNSISAFVVKYSGYRTRLVDEVPVKEERSTREIAQRLIYRSIATDEHLVAQHPPEGFEKGLTIPDNLVRECRGCNEKRGNMELHLWVKSHYQMIKNAQKYVDKVIVIINDNVIEKLHDYPLRISKTLDINTTDPEKLKEGIVDGLIKINVPAIKEFN